MSNYIWRDLNLCIFDLLAFVSIIVDTVGVIVLVVDTEIQVLEKGIWVY